MDPQEEEALWDKAKRGSEAAWVELWEHFHEMLVRFLRFARQVPAANAPDIASETLLALLKKPKSVRGRLRDWVFAAARNKAVDAFRQRMRERTVQWCRGDNLGKPVAGGSPAPDEGLCKQETYDKLQAALERLPFEERELLVLKYLEGMENIAIAAVVGKTPNAVGVALHRARSNLRLLLGGE